MARTENRQVPPIRDLLVHGHEAGVDIRLFRERAINLIPDPFAVVKEGMGEGGRDGCKRKPVGNGGRCGNKRGL